MIEMINGAGVVASAVLLGAMVFFSAVMAPLIFIRLDTKTAGGFIRQVFPWYYLFTIVFSVLATILFMIAGGANAAVMAVVTALAIVSRQILMPRINRSRDAMMAGDAAAGKPFNRLHRLSVWINGAQMIALVIVVARAIVTPA